jgi:hypothetical protein
MKLPVRPKRLLVFATLVAIAIAAAFSADRPADRGGKEIGPSERTTATPGAKGAASTGDLDLALLQRPSVSGAVADAFEGTTWYVPPPPPPPAPPAKPLPPPPPTAPPLPFTYLGRYQESSKPIFFLVKGDSVLSVSEGDVIEGAYRIDGVEGSLLNLTYLPLNIRQTINIGEAG